MRNNKEIQRLLVSVFTIMVLITTTSVQRTLADTYYYWEDGEADGDCTEWDSGSGWEIYGDYVAITSPGYAGGWSEASVAGWAEAPEVMELEAFGEITAWRFMFFEWVGVSLPPGGAGYYFCDFEGSGYITGMSDFYDETGADSFFASYQGATVERGRPASGGAAGTGYCTNSSGDIWHYFFNVDGDADETAYAGYYWGDYEWSLSIGDNFEVPSGTELISLDIVAETETVAGAYMDISSGKDVDIEAYSYTSSCVEGTLEFSY